MSHPAAEPGVPVEAKPADALPMPKEVEERAPQLASIAQTPDQLILRMNKLLATPGGLSAFLGTFNYTLYLLAYLEAHAPSRARLLQLLLARPSGPIPATAPAGPSRIAALGALLSQTRTTLRLFALFPLYAWFATLRRGPAKGQDLVLYNIAVAQCALYTAFQFLENVGLLTDKDILPLAWSRRFNRSGKMATLYLWSYRAWMGGVLCDILRLARQAQLQQRAKRAGGADVATREEGERADAKWWADLVVPLSWLPIAMQFSVEGGLPGFNLGIMGLCGAMAGLGRTAGLWAATKEG